MDRMHLSKLLIPCLVISTSCLPQVIDISQGCRDVCHSQQETPYGLCIKTCPDCHKLTMTNRIQNTLETYLNLLGHERPCTRLCERPASGGDVGECMKNCPKTFCVRYGNPTVSTKMRQAPTTTPVSPTVPDKTSPQTSLLASGVYVLIIMTCVVVTVGIPLAVLFKLCQKKQQQDDKLGEKDEDDEETTYPCTCTDVTTDAVKETGGARGELALLKSTTV